MYHIDLADRKRLIKIVTEYLSGKLNGKRGEALKDRFETIELANHSWSERMDLVFRDCFQQGYKHVLLLGSRTPTITAKMMKTALKMLNESDAVFGPTPEGRYYSLGMSGSDADIAI